jgi:hypothetical protein
VTARVVVFLGPSLPRSAAERVLRADYRPPARQGDVFRALEDNPAAIVLIDGVFESAPSVWHHELLAAHASGVALFGASSMGALRAAELPGVVRPVGVIARKFACSEWNDDAAVALLHGDASQGYRALTVPWVNVWATAEAARRAGVLRPREAAALVRRAEAVFYQQRTWTGLLGGLRWPSGRLERLRAFVRTRAVDLKAADARACLRLVARTRLRPRVPVAARLSSFVRRVRLPSDAGRGGGERGVRTLLLAEFARLAAIEPDASAVAAWEARLRGGAADQRAAWAQALALEAMVLAAPERFVADGPSLAEGAALERALRRRR